MAESNPSAPPSAEGEPKLSKSAQKKAATKAKKEEMKAQRKDKDNNNAAAQAQTEEEDVSVGNYGTLPLIQSGGDPTKRRVFHKVKDLNETKAEQNVLVRARVQATRGKGKLIFLVLRQRLFTVQAVISVGPQVSRKMVDFVAGIPTESIVDVEATVTIPKDKVESTTQTTVELSIHKIFVVSASESKRPFEVKDAACPKSVLKAQEREIQQIETELAAVEDQLKSTTPNSPEGQALAATLKKLKEKRSTAQKFSKVARKTRLDHRTIDLRAPANQAIFRVQSAIGLLFREFLINNDFTEIHSPKLIGCASEGGAEVFKVTYFDSWAYLAQSPQLYKQMAICSDMDRVFEVGPIFRAENSFTHRHLCEFVGLDI